MKPIADGYLYKSAPQAFHYAFSRPASVVVTGINSYRMLADDLRYAETYWPITQPEVDDLYQNAVELGSYVCRQCGKCSCPYGIDIPEVFACEGYYDRQMARGEAENTPPICADGTAAFLVRQPTAGKAAVCAHEDPRRRLHLTQQMPERLPL